MFKAKITKLTPEQEALIPVYKEKWQAIALSTEPVNYNKSKRAIQSLYRAMEQESPEILFFSSPHAAKSELLARPTAELAREFGSPLLSMPLSIQLLTQLQSQIDPSLWQSFDFQLQLGLEPLFILMQQLQTTLSPEESRRLEQLFEELPEKQWEGLWQEKQNWLGEEFKKLPLGELATQFGYNLWLQLGEPVWQNFSEPIAEKLSEQFPIGEFQQELRMLTLPFLHVGNAFGFMSNFIDTVTKASIPALIDFCVTELQCEVNAIKWLTLQGLVKNCGWILPFEKVCLVCARPRHFSFNEEGRLHGEGEPAIQFADGYSVYAYGGVSIPEKYGRIHPAQWQAEWLLREQNAELRRILIQGIGYGRLVKELQAVEIDSWREYTLLYIANNVDVEPIHLLKMVCPSTASIHALRVPPNIVSAREAIRWANWGVDPEDFAVAT